MKILMITPYLPYPLLSGGQIRTYNLLKNLSKKHQVSLISFIRSEQEITYVSNLKKFCTSVTVFLKRPPWSATSLILAAITFYPLVVCMYLNRKVKQTIEKMLTSAQFDLIHAETFYVMPNLPKTYLPIILVEQTIEYDVYQHYTKLVKNIIQKIIMNWDVVKIKFWEKKFWHLSTQVVAMSDSDKKIMEQSIHPLSVDLVPNGVDIKFFKKKNSVKLSKQTILFVGNFRWLQNREAVTILIKDIWPKIKLKIPNANLWIVGKYPPAEITAFNSKSIKVLDDIEDIRVAYKNCDILLAPIFGPGGTRYKILESMATGLPVVTTSTGIEGLGVKNEQEALISDTIDGLAELTVRVLTDKTLYKKIVKNARALVENKFNWDRIALKLDRIYENAAQKNTI